MACDICNRDGDFTRGSPKHIRRAVDCGFNPCRLGLLPWTYSTGPETGPAFQFWKSQVAEDDSDWAVCPGCLSAMTPYLVQHSQPASTGCLLLLAALVTGSAALGMALSIAL